MHTSSNLSRTDDIHFHVKTIFALTGALSTTGTPRHFFNFHLALTLHCSKAPILIDSTLQGSIRQLAWSECDNFVASGDTDRCVSVYTQNRWTLSNLRLEQQKYCQKGTSWMGHQLIWRFLSKENLRISQWFWKFLLILCWKFSSNQFKKVTHSIHPEKLACFLRRLLGAPFQWELLGRWKLNLKLYSFCSPGETARARVCDWSQN